MDPVLIGVPLFLALMALEHGVGRARGLRLYRLGGLADDLGSALGQLVVLAVLGATTFTMYEAIRGAVAVWDYPTEPVWAWVVGWILADFCWYWRHRFGHEVRLGWAIHEVHHQSPDLNLGVGLRVSVFQWAQTMPFVLPMALLGMPAWMFATLFSAAHVYQLLLHTQLFDRIGPLGLVLASPADHRVHHAANLAYRDKNFGHNLIVWDRLFGTYAVETPDDPVVYGIDRPLTSWDPVRNNLEPWLDLVGRRPPATAAAEMRATSGQQGWAVLWFALGTLGTVALVSNATTWPWWLRLPIAAWVLWTLAIAGRTLQGERAPKALEGTRLLLGAGLFLSVWGVS